MITHNSEVADEAENAWRGINLRAMQFKALASPVRLQIMRIFLSRERARLTVKELERELDQILNRVITQASVSHHIAILRESGLLARHHSDEGCRYYAIQPEVLQDLGDFLRLTTQLVEKQQDSRKNETKG